MVSNANVGWAEIMQQFVFISKQGIGTANIGHQEHWIDEQVVGGARVLIGCPVIAAWQS